jgi:2-aminoethylphosphonate-pyruvate transaminase
MICDAVSGFGVIPFRMSEHPECDVVVFTSNKCLEGLPGFGFAVAPSSARGLPRQCRVLGDGPRRCLRPRGEEWLGQLPLHAGGAVAARLPHRHGPLRRRGRAGAAPRALRPQREVLYDGLVALGFRPTWRSGTRARSSSTSTSRATRAGTSRLFIESLKARGVLVSNFWNTVEPTIRIAAIGAIEERDIRFALAQIEAVLAGMGVGLRAAA